MDTFDLKREQLKLANKILLNDNFTKITKVAGVTTACKDNKIIASVVLCEFPLKFF